MANFEAPLVNATIPTTYRTAGFLWVNTGASLGRRIQVYEIEFGQNGALNTSDMQVQWDVSRFTATAAAAGTSVSPNALDTADPAALSQYLNNLTTEPTNYSVAGSGLSIKNWGINQRGSYRWRALDDGDNIVVPNTTTNGIGVRVLAGTFTTGLTAVGNISFIER